MFELKGFLGAFKKAVKTCWEDWLDNPRNLFPLVMLILTPLIFIIMAGIVAIPTRLPKDN